MHNAITPIKDIAKPDPKDGIRVIYHTTPHRGLEILLPVFDHLAKTHEDIHLDVYSSFEIYGWKERDEQFKEMFDFVKNHDKMTYHGFKPNEEVREALNKAHIFAYPNIWMETSCLSLMEAMSAGCMCIHPDFGALPETASNWTYMYGFHEDRNHHAQIFYQALDSVIKIIKNKDEGSLLKVKSAKSYADLFYNWEVQQTNWEALIRSLLHLPKEIEPTSEGFFTYRVA